MMQAFHLIVLLVLVPAAVGQVTVALPLDGYYRPGKYFPARFDIDGHGGKDLVIGPAGGAQTRISIASDHAAGVAPLILLEETGQVSWALSDAKGSGEIQPPLKLLSPQQRLVGLAAGDASEIQELFPDRTIVPVKLDATNPLPGPPAAWGMLDAVVLDSISQLGVERISILLAGGTAIAVRSPEAPDSRWPWEQVGRLWVLRHDLCGPRWGGENAYPFSAVAGWQADWPAPFRRRVLLYAAIFAIICAGLALARPRWGAIGVVLLSAVAVGALSWWWHGRSAVLERAAMVVVKSGKLTQTDAWSFRASVSPAPAINPWDAVTWPLFEQKEWRYFDLSLCCREDGTPDRFTYRCPPAVKIAFLSRVVDLNQPSGNPQPIPPLSPLGYLANPTYHRPNCRVLGSLPSSGDEKNSTELEWLGTVLIQCDR